MLAGQQCLDAVLLWQAESSPELGYDEVPLWTAGQRGGKTPLVEQGAVLTDRRRQG